MLCQLENRDWHFAGTTVLFAHNYRPVGRKSYHSRWQSSATELWEPQIRYHYRCLKWFILTSRIQKSSNQHCLTPWPLKVKAVYSLQTSGISKPATLWSNPKDLNPQTTVYFIFFEAGFCKDCLKILVRLQMITVQNAVLGDVTHCRHLSWRWRQNILPE